MVSPETAARRKAIEEEYRAVTSKIPEKKKPSDPWGDIRSAPAKQQPQKQ